MIIDTLEFIRKLRYGQYIILHDNEDLSYEGCAGHIFNKINYKMLNNYHIKDITSTNITDKLSGLYIELERL